MAVAAVASQHMENIFENKKQQQKKKKRSNQLSDGLWEIDGCRFNVFSVAAMPIVQTLIAW